MRSLRDSQHISGALSAAGVSVLCVATARLAWGGAGKQRTHATDLMPIVPHCCTADRLCPPPHPLVQALTRCAVMQSRCRRSWRRCRAPAAWCRAPVRRGRPLRGAAARSAAARCTRPLVSSRGSSSSGKHRSAPATAAQAAAAGAAAPGECASVKLLWHSACCSMLSTVCLFQ